MTIDLRSDTVTLPTPGMRAAMAKAEVGDDVYGEDPTVNALEERSAALLGKPAAMFVPSGTMGNLLGVLVNAHPGEEVLADAASHVLTNEMGGAAAVGGVLIRALETGDGILRPEMIASALPHRSGYAQRRCAAVVIENTHNARSGRAWTLEELGALHAVARKTDLAIHMDGARLFNAAVASGCSPRQIAECADTVTFCLSKGLGCPAGSIFAGGAALVERARRWRKLLGGSMRQVGVLAAAGIYALDHHVQRLSEDHDNARTLAKGLASVPSLTVDVAGVRTNIVFARIERGSAQEFTEACHRRGLLVQQWDRDSVRLVTHLGVAKEDILQAIRIAGEAVAA